MAFEWSAVAGAKPSMTSIGAQRNASTLSSVSEATNGDAFGRNRQPRCAVDASFDGSQPIATISEKSPTAFPFPPPPFFFRTLLQPSQQQQQLAPWTQHPHSLLFANSGDAKSDATVAAVNGHCKLVEESNLKSDAFSSPKSQMNGSDRSFSVNMPQSAGRPAPENGLTWLADVAVHSRGVFGAASPDEKKSSDDSTSSFSQRNDTHFRASEIASGHAHGQYASHAPLPFQFPHIPSYLATVYQSQYCPSGHPSSPFLVPTPPASAPPTGRANYFGPDVYHQAYLNASLGSSNSILLPQNLSMRSPTRHSPISPSSMNSPQSGRNTSPLNTSTTTPSTTAAASVNRTPYIQSEKDSRIVHQTNVGREITLKHRILRPPNIDLHQTEIKLVDSAPMSAPPCPVELSENVFKKSRFAAESVPEAVTSHLHYPEYFHKGSFISLADGTVKRVEEMTTQDFINCASATPDLRIDSSVVVDLEEKVKDCSVLITFCVGKRKQKFTVEAPVEHPFYIYHQGWASCSPFKTLQRYGLSCKKLKVEDICISLARNASQKATSLLAKSGNENQSAICDEKQRCSDTSSSSVLKKRRHSAPETSDRDSPPLLMDTSKSEQSS